MVQAPGNSFYFQFSLFESNVRKFAGYRKLNFDYQFYAENSP